MGQQFPKFFRGPDGRLTPLTPEQQAEQDKRANEEQKKRFSPTDRIGQAILTGIPDFLLGALAGSGDETGMTPRVGGELLMAATPFGAMKAGGLKGFFSRVEKAVGAMPSQFHPNKAKSALSSLASKEELEYRKVPEYLSSFGNKTVKKDEFIDYLSRNQEPQLKITEKGQVDWDESKNLAYLRERGYDVTENEFGDPELVLQSGEEISEVLPDDIDTAFSRLYNQSGDETRYSTYTLPGGENYRETLIQLDKPPRYSTDDPELNRLMDMPMEQLSPEELTRITDMEATQFKTRVPDYQSSHWDEPNILAHVRHNDRYLGGNSKYGYRDPVTGQEGIKPGAVRFDRPKGRFIEEVQSDWHQAGRDKGYARQASEEEIMEARSRHGRATADLSHLEAQLMEEFGLTRRSALSGDARSIFDPQIGDRLNLGDEGVAEVVGRSGVYVDLQLPDGRMATRNRAALAAELDEMGALPRPEWLDDPRLRQLNDLGLRRMEAENALRAVESPEGVPDAPFKDSWPDLALKQQLIDVADRPDLEWLGFTTGKTQADRYSLSNHVRSVEYQPSTQRLEAYDPQGEVVVRETVPPERLHEYIGREAAERLLSQRSEHYRDPSKFTVIPNITRDWDSGGDVQRGWNVLFDGRPVSTEIGFDKPDMLPDEALRSVLEGDQRLDSMITRRLEGLDLETGGEGMKYFYDQLLPKRLEKILKSIDPNAKVARESIGTELKRQMGSDGMPDLPKQENVEAWIARLTPEMKQHIKEKGLPLLMMLMASPEARTQFERSFGTKQAITNPPGGF